MENVHSAGQIPYEPAPPLKSLTPYEKLKFIYAVLIDVIKVLVLSVPIFIDSFMKLFISPSKKAIEGQIALITGGGNGIGRAIAIRLAQEGCHIVIADIDGKAAKQTADDICQFNVKAIGYEIDVANSDDVLKLKSQIEKDLGPIDILVNNAGLMPLLSLREGLPKDINRITSTNINANFWTVRTFIGGMMQRRRGHIIGISSMSAFHPMGGAIIYTSTKFAVAGFLQALEQELRQEGFGDCIHYTCVHPYFVSTRKDLMEAVNLRFPPITAEYTAEVTVDAIRRNIRVVSIPKFDKTLTKFLSYLPDGVQFLIRDYILKEKESRMFKTSDKLNSIK